MYFHYTFTVTVTEALLMASSKSSKGMSPLYCSVKSFSSSCSLSLSLSFYNGLCFKGCKPIKHWTYMDCMAHLWLSFVPQMLCRCPHSRSCTPYATLKRRQTGRLAYREWPGLSCPPRLVPDSELVIRMQHVHQQNTYIEKKLNVERCEFQRLDFAQFIGRQGRNDFSERAEGRIQTLCPLTLTHVGQHSLMLQLFKGNWVAGFDYFLATTWLFDSLLLGLGTSITLLFLPPSRFLDRFRFWRLNRCDRLNSSRLWLLFK